MKFRTDVLPFILWILVIFLLSAVPGNQYPREKVDISLLAHVLEFTVLAFLMTRMLGEYSFKKLLVVLIFCLSYAIVDELHQSFVPFRSVSFIDWLFDALGVFVGIALYYLNKRLKIKA